MSLKMRIGNVIRRHFLTGLLVWTPVIVTIFVIKFIVELLDKMFFWLPHEFRPEVFLGVNIPGFGVILSLVVLLFTGFFAANFIGSYFLELMEKLWSRIPLVRTIYTAVKQVMETVMSPQGQAFRKVVLVRWPHRDMWTIAFVTTQAVPVIADAAGAAGAELIHVFVPATPNITSGFLMMVEKDQVRDLAMSIDEALKCVVSLGVMQPQPQINKKS